jgi:hypothetical protein
MKLSDNKGQQLWKCCPNKIDLASLWNIV